MSEALATKYRPKDFDSIIGQDSVIKILSRQIETNEIKNCYLLCGASGCGKTTLARAFANRINNGCGSPIEIDAASNSGVDNVRNIIADANERAIDCKYKVFIIDETHSLSNTAWQAFLKTIEEPPTFTIFIFCTTNPEKIPDTILNRVQRFNFNRIPVQKIVSRLNYICEQEHFYNYKDAIEYIAKISDGGMRYAISLLDKCAGYSHDLSINNVVNALGNYSYDTFFELTNSIIDGNQSNVLKVISDFYDNGNDLKLFVDKFLDFELDVTKYAIFKNCDMTKIPTSMIDKLEYSVNFEDSLKYFNYIIDKLLSLKNMLKNDNSPKSTIEVVFMQMTRFV